MLNRTNRKLSAKTNGLNLGTRKLAGKASANLGILILHSAARPHPVRVGGWDVRGSVGLDAIMRSYPPMRSTARTTSTTDSSLRLQPLFSQGIAAGNRCQVVRLATRITAGSAPNQAEPRERIQSEAVARFSLAPISLGSISSVPPQSMFRDQVPEARP